MELAQLFQDLETLVVQQENAVAEIENKGVVITDNVGKGNTELDGAVKKAKAARKKKWICFWIVGMYQLIRLLAAYANCDSRHHCRCHHHCPCRLGGQWYVLREENFVKRV